MAKILVVDDSKADRTLVEGLLTRTGAHEVIQAGNGVEALSRMQSAFPDLVLTDLHMPQMTGIELVRALRFDHPEIPVILMTGQGSEEVAAESLKAGAASYIPKRRMSEHLLEIVQQVLCTAQGQQSRAHLMHYMDGTKTRFRIPNDLRVIRLAVDLSLNMLRSMRLADETERLRVGIGLREALENACFRGNLEMDQTGGNSGTREVLISERRHQRPFCDRWINFEIQIDRQSARFIISDEGPGFDVQQMMTNADESIDPRYRGLVLMHSVMDHVEFNETGNQVTLIKHCASTDEEMIYSEDPEPAGT
ncbi:ATP-binding response regulator [Rubinisphaera margarita]|uniref:ATP-binding response regulator n=1 Tax=Rubinisphaera margarita TaxID=2909586 RepID=UPI001EE8D463|nr:response regulator [Rubinisphaera margarita]MCG6154420.1 response regulator [Rubinisphaera margarita]